MTWKPKYEFWINVLEFSFLKPKAWSKRRHLNGLQVEWDLLLQSTQLWSRYLITIRMFTHHRTCFVSARVELVDDRGSQTLSTRVGQTGPTLNAKICAWIPTFLVTVSGQTDNKNTLPNLHNMQSFVHYTIDGYLIQMVRRRSEKLPVCSKWDDLSLLHSIRNTFAVSIRVGWKSRKFLAFVNEAWDEKTSTLQVRTPG